VSVLADIWQSLSQNNPNSLSAFTQKSLSVKTQKGIILQKSKSLNLQINKKIGREDAINQEEGVVEVKECWEPFVVPFFGKAKILVLVKWE